MAVLVPNSVGVLVGVELTVEVGLVVGVVVALVVGDEVGVVVGVVISHVANVPSTKLVSAALTVSIPVAQPRPPSRR